MCRAHYLMLPDVPFVGWDVALTDKGIYLLEVNLSCNFFRGSFDKPKCVRPLSWQSVGGIRGGDCLATHTDLSTTDDSAVHHLHHLRYFAFCRDYLVYLQAQRQAAGSKKGN